MLQALNFGRVTGGGVWIGSCCKMLQFAECEILSCKCEFLQDLNFFTFTDGGRWKETC